MIGTCTYGTLNIDGMNRALEGTGWVVKKSRRYSSVIMGHPEKDRCMLIAGPIDGHEHHYCSPVLHSAKRVEHADDVTTLCFDDVLFQYWDSLCKYLKDAAEAGMSDAWLDKIDSYREPVREPRR